MDVLRKFENQTGILRILLYLYENRKRKSMVTEIMKGSGVNQAPMYRSLEILREYGIISKERQIGFPPRSLYQITPEGVEVAKSVLKLKQQLEELTRKRMT